MVQAGSSGLIRGEADPPLSDISSHHELESLAQSVTLDLIDEAILGVVFEVHKSAKRGLLFLDMGNAEDEEEFQQVETEGLDVFGQAPVKKHQECLCPNCSRSLAASRFAPHLEKCMGMGRNSSRIASRRIQNSTRDTNNFAGSDDDDEDWVTDRKRKKRDKNSPRRVKKEKRNGQTNTQINSYNSAVDNSKKISMRSLRQQNLSDQRKSNKDMGLCMESDMVPGLLSSNNTATARAADSTTASYSYSRVGSMMDVDEIQVDINGLEEAHMSSSWDHDLSNTTSPADSTSTNNSTSSNFHRRSSKSKKKSSKSSKSSTSSMGSMID